MYVSMYLIHLTNIGKSVSTINVAYYSISWAHKLVGVKYYSISWAHILAGVKYYSISWAHILAGVKYYNISWAHILAGVKYYSISWAHRLAGVKDPCKSDLVITVKEGAHRSIGHLTVKKRTDNTCNS